MTFFVGGVHGVGKTFLLKPACEKLGVRYAAASQLILEQRGSANWTRTRQVKKIDENQRLLVASVRRLEEVEKTVVIDGHFVLRHEADVFERIGVETFVQINVRGIILFEAPSVTVAERLKQRNDLTWKAAEIDELAHLESDHAEFVSRRLAVPLVRLYRPSDLDVSKALAGLIT